MGYVYKSNHMKNSYSTRRSMWKWTKKLFFHLVDASILNGSVLLASCGSTFFHRNFRLVFARDLIQGGGEGYLNHRPQHGENTSATNPTRLDL
jgi:hypothetical protein